jgi:CO dehydrogenase/acetyl-CoA synthase beta subunit
MEPAVSVGESPGVRFDPSIEGVHRFIEEMKRRGRLVRELAAGTDRDSVACALSRSNGAGPSIVLKADTFLELGSPSSGSCAMLLWTDSRDLIQDARIVLVGPDVGETASSQLSFGQVVMAAGIRLGDGDAPGLRSWDVSIGLDGYMVKSTSENIWARISRDAAREGFCFRTLGSELIRGAKATDPRVQAVEVVLVTSSRDDVSELDGIGRQAREVARELRDRIWRDRGIDLSECAPGGHCGSCDDAAACEQIQRMGRDRRKDAP